MAMRSQPDPNTDADNGGRQFFSIHIHFFNLLRARFTDSKEDSDESGDSKRGVATEDSLLTTMFNWSPEKVKKGEWKDQQFSNPVL